MLGGQISTVAGERFETTNAVFDGEGLSPKRRCSLPAAAAHANFTGRGGSVDVSDLHAPQMRGGDTARIFRLRDLELDHEISLSANAKVLV